MKKSELKTLIKECIIEESKDEVLDIKEPMLAEEDELNFGLLYDAANTVIGNFVGIEGNDVDTLNIHSDVHGAVYELYELLSDLSQKAEYYI